MTARRAFLTALAAFFLISSAWALAMPVDGTYDESQHLVRAYAVADGQWLSGGPDRLSFDVPATLLPENADCMWRPRPPEPADRPPLPASCQRPAEDTGTVVTSSYVARYNPVYYLPVGLPLLLWPDTTGVLLARLVSGLLSSLMLAAAVWVAASLGNRLLVAAVALVATPTVVNLAGSVNPNGVEIAAAVLLFVALLGLLGGGGPARRALLGLAGVAAFTLVTVRHVGPALLAVDVLAVAVVAGAARVRRELRSRDTWTVLGGCLAAAALVFLGWLVAARSPVGATPRPADPPTTADIVEGLFTHRIVFYVKQIVGQFGYGETTMSPVAIALWYAVLAVVVVPAVLRASWRVRAALAWLFVAAGALLVGFEFVFVPMTGKWFSHGRYALPILAGVVLVAAWASRPASRWLPVALVAATVPVHLYALVRVMSRYQVGIATSFDPFGGSWHPPLGSVLPLTVLALGVVVLTITPWSESNIAHGDENGTETGISTRTVSAN